MLKRCLRLFSLSATLLFLSCAVARVEIPVYEGIDVREALYAKSSISTIETIFSINFEKDDVKMNGDGFLNISKNGDLNLRIYSLGFLALEVTSEKGIIKSTPLLDTSKGKLLTHGLRNCFFWWDIEDSDINETEDTYLLKNQARMLWIDRKTMLPIKQTIFLEDSRELTIYYERPQKMNDIWHPSKIRIELPHYDVTLKIKELTFNPSVDTKLTEKELYYQTLSNTHLKG